MLLKSEFLWNNTNIVKEASARREKTMLLNAELPPQTKRVSNQAQYDYVLISADGVKGTNDGVHWERLENLETATVEDIANKFIVGGMW